MGVIELAIACRTVNVDTKGDVDLVNITEKIAFVLRELDINEGIVTIFVPGATAAVSTMEYEPGLLKDFPNALERVAPSEIEYAHNRTWGCDNGKSHVRATLLGPSLVVPFKDKRLLLGTWQQIVLCEFDTRPRKREIILQIMGE